jgi:hypothetical protein
LLRRLAATSLSCALALSIVGVVGLPGPARPAARPGTVRTVPLAFAGGTRLGRVQVQGARSLAGAKGAAGQWVSDALDAGGVRLVGLSWANRPGAPWTRPGGARTYLRTRTGAGWTAWRATRSC